MIADVQSLPAGDIDRSAPSGAPVTENGGTYPEAQLSETQTAALKEAANLLWSRQPPRQVERDPPQEFRVAGQRCVGNAIPLHFVEDIVVNEILSGYFRSKACRANRER